MNREPVVTYVSVGVLLGLVVSGLSVWGLPLTDAQQEWLSSVAMAIAPIIAAVLARRKVTPVD